ncbi:MAG: glycerophosphodiester phosphodiesterase family protein [Bacteroidota bacterium]
MNQDIDIQGHRGCRGLKPENTITAFKEAVDIGVKTLELDVVVNKYNDVIISHEPFFNHEISTGPKGEEITEENEKEHNMYQMSLEEIQSYDVGMKSHPRFPIQKKMTVAKPTLKEMVTEIEAYVRSENHALPEYNIEIKRVPENDSIFHPKMKDFADAVCQEIIDLGIAKRTTVQCFDIESLQYVKKAYPEFRLVLLIMNMKPFQENIKELGFKPWAYSPYFKLVSEELIAYGEKENIQIIPWTVNDEQDIVEMLKLGVDGIISDYPDRVVEIVSSYTPPKK